MPLLQARNVSKNFGGVQALKDVSLDLPESAVLGLIGPNGSGKSTLLNIIAGVEKPTSGIVKLDGKRIDNLRTNRVVRYGLAKTHQIPKPFSNMTAIENVAVAVLYGRRNIHSPTPALEEADKILSMVRRGYRRTWGPRTLLLEIKKVSAGYGGTQIVWGFSMQCKDGTISVIVGPNGAGKTTTLKTVNGLLKPWSGGIYFGGNDITDLPAFRRVEGGLASCPEGRRLFPQLSTEANLMLGAYSRRARHAAEKTLDFVYGLFPKLKERAKLNVGKLSGGEQQMVSIGRALMTRPKMIILDEPSLGLAPKLTAEIFEKLVELRKEGLSMLIVEQNAVQALGVADYAYVLQEGKIINEGPPTELMDSEELRKAYFSIE